MRFILHGLVVESDVALAAPSSDAAPNLWISAGQVPEAPGGRAGETLLALAGPPDDPFYSAHALGDGRVLLHHKSLLDALIDPSDGTVRYQLVAPERPELLEVLLSGNVLALYLSLRGHLVLHASAVQRDGFTLAAVGDSGAGKSSLAAHCAADGWRFLADDVLRADVDGDAVRVHAGGSELRLRGDAQAAAALLPGRPQRGTGDARTAVTVRAGSAEFSRLSALVLPMGEPADAAPVKRLSGSSALLALTATPRTAWCDPAVEAARMRQLASLVRLVPVFALPLPAVTSEHYRERLRHALEEVRLACAAEGRR